MAVDAAWLKSLIREIPDFPKPGIGFKDITPLLADAAAFRSTMEAIGERWAGLGIDHVVGIEARGFIPAAPVADRLGAGFVPVRKTGKLPAAVAREEYALEYGVDAVEVHRDVIEAGHRVLIVDDVIATGGTAAASVRLVEGLGGVVVGLAFIVELAFLRGRDLLAGYDLQSLLTYD
jgi:adenine phosphoribosyltransferase